jgi:hypothetical protein
MASDIPMEWIDNLFNCMAMFYGERWTKNLEKPHAITFAKAAWKSSLDGLTYEQIKNTLKYLKRAAQDPAAIPPHQLEFWRYAKKNIIPHINYTVEQEKGDPAIAKAALEDIYQKVHGYQRTIRQGV